MPKLGIIAGSGLFPIQLAEAAASQGWEVVVFAIEGEADASTFPGKIASRVYTIPLMKMGTFFDKMREEKITDAVMAGKVQKRKIFGNYQPDARTIKMYMSLKDSKDDTLLGAVAHELESEGITLHPSTFCLRDILAIEGNITPAGPTKEQWDDIRFGWGMAKEIGRLDIGQTVVVKGKAVLAVEAIEGTDEAILRGGKLAGEGAVVVKVAKPQQDTRFDMPAVGVNTIESMIAAKARVLAIEAEWTVILDRKTMVERATEHGIVMVACPNPPGEYKP